MSPTWLALAGLWAAASAQAPVQAARLSPSAAASQPAAPTSRRDSPAADRRSHLGPSPPQELNDHFALITGNNTAEARKLGASRLLEAGTDDAITKLTAVLRAKSPDQSAQIAVCEAVADSERPDPSLIAPLLALLGDPRSTPEGGCATRDREGNVSGAATHALQRFPQESVVGQLCQMVADESIELDRRLAAINALGAMSDSRRAMESLIGLLNDASPTIQMTALAAIRHVADGDVTDIESAQAWWTEHKGISDYEWLQRRNDQRSMEIHTLLTESAALTARLAAAYRDSYHHSPEGERPPKLLAMLNDSVPGIRQLGLDLVNDLITDRKDVTLEIKARLIDMLTDPQAAVRLQTTKIVGDLRLPGVFARLGTAMTQEADPAVRVAQIKAIGRLDDAGIVQVLLERLDDDVPAVVGEAAISLGRCSRRTDWPKEAARGESVNGSVAGLANIPETLIKRYGRVRVTENDLREQFLTAMSMIGDARFRSVFKSEISEDRAIRVRRAAIAGLAAFGDIEAADSVRQLLGDKEPEIRLAAADVLAKCGRRQGDLGALAEHLNPAGEPDALVRQKAWESHQLICSQLAPEEQIRVSDEFDKSADKLAQRRRLELLKPLAADTRMSGSPGAKAGAAKFEPLPRARRVEVLERMADSQWNLGEFAAAAASLDQVLALMEEPKGGRHQSLAARGIAARLKAHEDALAMRQVGELLDASRADASAPGVILNALVDEVRVRIDTATEATAFADALSLIELARPTIRRVGAAYEVQVDALRSDALARRTATVDRLLASLGSDADSEPKLLAYPSETVLSRLHERLKAAATTTAPVSDAEIRLIQLARRLAPAWSGFPEGATPQQRSEALDKLLNAAATKSAS